ncbi:MAG: tRNA pseudouridine(55) synthase TruB [Phycisphaerales bacterium]|nr:tRNA pseudouridine(55) synthase TruB [Phycisphaerales bacterium]
MGILSAVSFEQQSHDERPPICGVLNINKSLRLTSMMACRVVKGKLKSGGAPKKVKVGHGGTLDPLATGVLVVLIGKATKQQDRIMGTDKAYRAVVDLAHTSESCDMEFEQIPAVIARKPTLEEVRAVCDRFEGDVEQVPPMYSAIRINGRRAYALARQGVDVEMKSRVIRIDSIEIVEYAFPMLTIDIRCGKGTYIRSLARDIGAELGVGGMLASLERTAVGRFRIEDALTLDELPEVLDPWDLPLAGLE